jgi:hypothetical protein
MVTEGPDHIEDPRAARNAKHSGGAPHARNHPADQPGSPHPGRMTSMSALSSAMSERSQCRV